jgi:hypothetical protein
MNLPKDRALFLIKRIQEAMVDADIILDWLGNEAACWRFRYRLFEESGKGEDARGTGTSNARCQSARGTFTHSGRN